jgi:hypothetical protein
MLTSVDKNTMKGKWITFRWIRNSESGKTQGWEVVNTDNSSLLGYVEWFGRWRKYAFRPLSLTFYEQDCLREIAEFVELQTTMHRSAQRANKVAKQGLVR